MAHRCLGLIRLAADYLPAYTDKKAFGTLDGDTIRGLALVISARGWLARVGSGSGVGSCACAQDWRSEEVWARRVAIW